MRIVIATVKTWNAKNFYKLEKKFPKIKFKLITNKNELNYTNIQKFNPQWIFVPHWNWIIPKEVFNHYKTVIFHMTDLPFGRGGSPLQNLIIRGIYETKISAIKCVAKMDAGPVYMKLPFSFYFGNANEILTKMSNIIFNKMIPKIIEENPYPKSQVGHIVEFKRRTKEQSNIKDVQNIEKAYDFIRMLDGEDYPPAFLETEHLTFKFKNAKIDSEKNKVTAEVEVNKK